MEPSSWSVGFLNVKGTFLDKNHDRILKNNDNFQSSPDWSLESSVSARQFMEFRSEELITVAMDFARNPVQTEFWRNPLRLQAMVFRSMLS